MAKKSTQERALSNSDTFIPPHYFPARYFSTPPRKDMQRGELTQGKNITGAFTELRREAKAVQYRLLRNTIHEVLGSRQAAIEKAGLWPGFVTERDAMASDTYGDTLNRALRTWTLYTVRIATEEEARLTDERNGTPKDAGALVRYSRTWYGTHCEREGINDPELTGLQRFRAEHCNLPDLHDAALVEYFDRHPLPTWFRMGTTEERRIVTGPEDAEIGDYAFVRPTQEVVPAVDQYARWNVEYTAEVEMCVEHFADSPDLGSELTGLIGALRSFEVSTGEGKAVVEHLRKTGVGSEVLTMMQHGKDRLLKRLEEIAKDITVETPNATTSGTVPLFTWKGQPAELFALFEELVGKGWVEVPKNRGKRSRDQLARNVHGAFQFSTGTALQVGTAVNYLKKGRDGVNEQRPEPRVAFALKRNPDVGDNYDPDKAGE